MDMIFAKELMDRTGFPEAAKLELLEQGSKLSKPELDGAFRNLMDAYRESDFHAASVNENVEILARQAGMHRYTLWLLLLIACAKEVKPEYHRRGVSEKVYWDTFCDLKYKALECWENYGVWGNFVAFWYDIFFRADIVKLGRLEYELRTYQAETPYTCGDITVRKGDSVLSIHIPSSGEPFDREAVMESLRLAHAHFGRDVLVCECHSWLLYPGYEKVWPAGGNVLAFRELFDILYSGEYEKFGEGWRVFGSAWRGEIVDLPERTTMQRAFKTHILAGGKFGDAYGLLLFDGRSILNK